MSPDAPVSFVCICVCVRVFYNSLITISSLMTWQPDTQHTGITTINNTSVKYLLLIFKIKRILSFNL